MCCPKREMTVTECLEVLRRLLIGVSQTLQIDTYPEKVSDLISSIGEIARKKGFAVASMNLESVERLLGPVPLAAGLEEELHVQIRRGAVNANLVDRKGRHVPEKTPKVGPQDALLIIDASDYEGDSQLIDVALRARAFADYMVVVKLWILFIHDEQRNDLGPVVADDLTTGWIKAK